MFIRAELYHKVGGLDDDFFAHMEEIDFCWRLKNSGYKIMYCPHSVIFHVGGGTLPKNNPHKTYLNFRNNLFLLYKNLPSGKLFPVFFIRFFLDGIAAIKFLFEGHVMDFFAVWKAHYAFYFAIPKLIRKRRMFKHTDVSCIYQQSIVYEHYLKGGEIFGELDKECFSK